MSAELLKLKESLTCGFYSLTRRFDDEADAAVDAVATYLTHKKLGYYCHFVYGGPAHQAPPRFCKPLYEATGVFILATAACEISNYEDVWAKVYNVLADSHLWWANNRGDIPRMSVLRQAVIFHGHVWKQLTSREIIDTYVVNDKADFENELTLNNLIVTYRNRRALLSDIDASCE